MQPHRRAEISRVAALLLASLVAACAAQAQPRGPAQRAEPVRVVVFGDVHGAYGALVELLVGTGVIGPDLEWRGGTTRVVSLGDLLDRGPDSRRVLDLIMRLQGEAAAVGGALHVVLGNHEAMNLLGDWRYVTAADYAAFAADETARMRAAGYAAFVVESGGDDSPAARDRFERSYPQGYFARQAAFEPTGAYGAWLLSLPAIVVLDGTAYAHGGLPAVVAEQGLEINARVRAAIARRLELRAELSALGLLPRVDRGRDAEAARAALSTATRATAPLLEELVVLDAAVELGVEGPLWYRGSVYCKPLLEVPTLEAALAAVGARRVVVGHTPTGDRRAHALYGGKLVIADTGMLVEYYRGRPSALVLDDGDIEVRYVEPPERARLGPDAELNGIVIYGRTEQVSRAALAQGLVTNVERGEGAAPWRVVLEHAGATFEAFFYPRGDDGAGDLELAADAFDELLGTTLVAPTVPRAIDGEEGALQLRYPGAISEADRLARGLGVSGWCPIEPQIRLMYAFDALTFNRGRAATNIVFANDLTDLTLTDHRQAFGADGELPASFALAIPPALASTLQSLDEPRLTAALGPWLDSRRIRALLARRDRLLD